ncbi:hypothetical protein K501DRAFT_328252 [Backusella circina FSU 941]|nr:hypothetical protein K501DRAFT_328252 [Backusella circina FSU 941]
MSTVNDIIYYNTYSRSSVPSVTRLDQFQTQLELARNFYDDYEFCPVQCSEETTEHRDRIQQRISPQSSPSNSPTMSSPTKRAIPIIDPNSMAPVSVPAKSPVLAQQWMHYNAMRPYHGRSAYSNVLVQ